MLAAFGRTSSAAPDRFLIALAALDLLSDAAAHSPLLVIAEDAQWLDRPTCDVLTFVARRWESDPITLLMAVREGSQSALLNAGLTELHLDRLPEPDAAALLDACAPQLSAAMRRRVLQEARGNPLALLERPFVSRYDELPLATRTALLVAAVDDALEVGEVLRATSVMRSRPVRI